MPIAFYNWMNIWFTGTGFDFKNTDGKIDTTYHSTITAGGYTSLIRFGKTGDVYYWNSVDTPNNLGLFLGTSSATATSSDYKIYTSSAERTSITSIPTVVT